jgi:hypothetical protein
MLHTLYMRGRHHMTNTLTATQKFNPLRPMNTVNATELFVYRWRNMKYLETFIDEVSNVVDKKSLMEVSHTATTEPYSFPCVRLNLMDRYEMFFQYFGERLII